MKRAILSVIVALVTGPAAAGQEDSTEQFVVRARRATEKYQDRAVAIREGYRRIGRDFPAMGEHWINIGLVFDGKLDAAYPEILNYASVSGTPQLLGVAYAVPLLKGERAPEWPAGMQGWHDHFKTVEEETVLPQHHSAGQAGDASRLAMLHAWIWTANPAGIFAADNWAIPYSRLEIAVPEDAPAGVAKALSLVNGGAEYFLMCMEAAVAISPMERTAIEGAFARAGSDVLELLHGRSKLNLTAPELTALDNSWTELWVTIEALVTAEKRQHLHHLSVR